MYDIKSVRNMFPMIKNHPDMIYFDNGATTFKPETVIESVNKFYNFETSNIHRGDYDVSFNVSKQYDETRSVIKEFINANKNEEIVFTSGATGALNLVAFGYGLTHLKKGDVLLTTLEEHASNILPWFKVAEKTGCIIKYIDLNEDGTFNLDNYKKCFEDKNIKIVSLPHVSNVLGYVNPLKEIIKVAHENGAIVNVDGAQSVPHLKTDVKDLDIDFLSFSAHKMCGPDGIGVLYGKYELLKEVEPTQFGGGSNARFEKDGSIILKEIPERFESGTPNIEGVLGLKNAVKFLMDIGMDEIHKHDEELVKYLIEKLSKLDNIDIYNLKGDSGICSFNVKGVFAQDTGSYLNKYNICVRSGNQCAKLLHNVIGATEVVRVSLYLYNTKEEIDKFVEVIKGCNLETAIGAVI